MKIVFSTMTFFLTDNYSRICFEHGFFLKYCHVFSGVFGAITEYLKMF